MIEVIVCGEMFDDIQKSCELWIVDIEPLIGIYKCFEPGDVYQTGSVCSISEVSQSANDDPDATMTGCFPLEVAR